MRLPLTALDRATVFKTTARVVGPRLGFDKSVRSIDADGRMHVAVTNISRSGVNPYFGNEIVGGASLGLDPGRIYNVFRPPGELVKAAPSFNRVPLLSQHVMADAADHRPDLVVGSTGSDAQFADPYLRCSLVVWAQAAIDAIEDGNQRQLSAAYRYRYVPQPGSFQEISYNGYMTEIRGSHVALVDQGRAGPDVMVGDIAPPPLRKLKAGVTPMADTDDDTTAILAKLKSYLEDVLGPDQMQDVETILAGGEAKAEGAAAMDSLARADVLERQARALRHRAMTAGRASFLERFPGAGRLKGF